jgi:muramidase (phage lysozyme)
MLEERNELDKDILEKIRKLPEVQKIGVLNYIDFLNEKFTTAEERGDVNQALKAVEDTWGSIKLSKEDLKYIAEDKNLEYEI